MPGMRMDRSRFELFNSPQVQHPVVETALNTNKAEILLPGGGAFGLEPDDSK